MSKNSDSIIPELLEAFNIEAAERVKNLTDVLVRLEKSQPGTERDSLVESIFRDVHSLKGAARSIGRTDLEKICQSAESIFSMLKKKTLELSAGLTDLLFAAFESIQELIQSDKPEVIAAARTKAAALAETFRNISAGTSPVSAPSPVSAAPPPSPPVEKKEPEPVKTEKAEKTVSAAATIRMSLATLDNLMTQVEELRGVKLMAQHQVTDLNELSRELSSYQRDLQKQQRFVRQLRTFIKKYEAENPEGNKSFLTAAEKLIDAYSNNAVLLKTTGSKVTNLFHSAEHSARATGVQVDNLFWGFRKLLMMPFGTVLDGFPKIVRDLAKDQGKEIDFRAEGEDIEIDRRILEEIKDPLIHLIRNSIDHGIENPETRLKKNKSRSANLSITAVQKRGQHIEIRLSDDGRGVDTDKLRETVRKQNLVPADKIDSLTEAELHPFIFHSGISTKSIITDISGRGLGLAIVSEKIEKLGGSIRFESERDKGTSFIMTLPLTLAAFRGVLAKTNRQLLIIPSSNLDRVMVIEKEKIITLENREAINVNGEMVSLVRLGEVAGLPRAASQEEDPKTCHILILQSAGQRIAFLVDEIIGEQELLVKNLGRQLLKIKNIIGASVLGNGKLVLIFDPVGLIKTAIDMNAGSAVRAQAAAGGGEEKKKINILVTDDSLTSRMLIKSILESAGYKVTTAVNGLDAFEQISMGDFDLLVSDVDMPKMNGFILTEKVRNDKRLSSVPVILITSLETKEDRERGIDVGANAYIVKKSFDQSNLLEIVQRLV